MRAKFLLWVLFLFLLVSSVSALTMQGGTNVSVGSVTYVFVNDVTLDSLTTDGVTLFLDGHELSVAPEFPLVVEVVSWDGFAHDLVFLSNVSQSVGFSFVVGGESYYLYDGSSYVLDVVSLTGGVPLSFVYKDKPSTGGSYIPPPPDDEDVVLGGDLLLFVEGASLGSKECSYTVSPEYIRLSNEFPNTTFLISNYEGFTLVPVFEFFLLNGSMSGDVVVSDGVVLQGLSRSFSVGYERGGFAGASNFTGYLKIVIPECYDVGVPVDGDFSLDRGVLRLSLDKLNTPFKNSSCLWIFLLVWLVVFLLVFFRYLKDSYNDNKALRFVVLLFLIVLLSVIFALITCVVVGGLT